MRYCAHRINTVDELRNVPSCYGVEIDLRDSGDRIILVHDPFSTGEDFETFLKAYQHSFIILNIKSERIEHRVLELLQKYKVTDYFFLDSSFPMIYLLSNNGESKVALRYSELEGIDTIRTMQGKVEWVWVDCFSKFPLDKATSMELKKLGYKLCLVSPELQGRAEDIESYADILNKEGIEFDMICTKIANIERWKGRLI